MATSWDGQNPAGYGVAAGLVQGVPAFGQNFMQAYQRQNAAADEAARAAADLKLKQRLADLHEKQIADQATQHGEKIDQAYVLAGDKAGIEARNPLTPEEQAQYTDYETTMARRKQAGGESITGMSEANAFNRIGQTPLDKPNADPNDLILGFDDPQAKPPTRFSGVNPDTGGEMQNIEAIARPTVSERGVRLGAAAQAARERKNADDEFKAELEINKQANKLLNDAEIADARDKTNIRIAAIRSQAANILANLAVGKEEDFKRGVENYRDPETGVNPFYDKMTKTHNYPVARSWFTLIGKPISVGGAAGVAGKMAEPEKTEITRLDKSILNLEEELNFERGGTQNAKKAARIKTLTDMLNEKKTQRAASSSAYKEEIGGGMPGTPGQATTFHPAARGKMPAAMPPPAPAPVDPELEAYRKETGNPSLTRAQLDAIKGTVK